MLTPGIIRSTSPEAGPMVACRFRAPVIAGRRVAADPGICRAYRPDPLPLADLAAVLDGAYGVAAMVTGPAGLETLARVVPSAGGLYPLELYVASRGVAGVTPGLHRYNVLYHSLEPLRAGPAFEDLRSALMTRDSPRRPAPCWSGPSSSIASYAKDGPRGYRYALLEAGHSAQNACLVASERSLGTLCIGGFRDALLNETLALDVRQEAASLLHGRWSSRGPVPTGNAVGTVRSL